MINELLETITSAIERAQPQDLNQVWLPRIAAQCDGLMNVSEEELERLLDEMGQIEPSTSAKSDDDEPGSVLPCQLFHPIIRQLCDRERVRPRPRAWSESLLAHVTRLYQITPEGSDVRNHLLCWLASSGEEPQLKTWAQILSNDPPHHRMGIVLAFGPVMQPDFHPPKWMMEQLLNNAAGHLQIAPAIFDLANFYFRTEKLAEHPASSRADQLTALLGQLVGEMGKIEEGQLPSGTEGQATALHLKVADCVSLIVALCDALALIDHEPAVGKLHQAAELKHRRVKTEATAALARLGDESGKENLIAMAEHPVARLRVLAFAEELGFLDEISLEFQGEIAMAESRVAIWLAEPAQMGLAPTSIRLLDNRELYWPSYEHPVQCYLFEFTYGGVEQSYSNVAICGPLVHTFQFDLRPLETDTQYAAFAGWQTLHDEIFHMTPGQAEQTFNSEWRRLTGALADDDSFEDATPVAAGSFFGQLILIASAISDSIPGTVIVEGGSAHWFGAGNPESPIDWRSAFDIWKGQKLLTNFNATE